jgi:hypothetical protein
LITEDLARVEEHMYADGMNASCGRWGKGFSVKLSGDRGRSFVDFADHCNKKTD